MNERLVSGQLDFAFVDAYTMDRQIRLESVYDERLHWWVRALFLERRKLEVPKTFKSQ